MLKCNIDLEESCGLKFEDLEIGDTFILDNYGEKFIGMKANDSYGDDCLMVLNNEVVGHIYNDIENYDILELIDLEIVRR